MSKRKGLSAEQKRERLLEIYHTRKEPFNLKEIESLGSKAGVVQQTIKDVNQSLVDDGLVMSDKIGSANFFWAFPSQAYQSIKVRVEDLEQKTEQTAQTVENLKRKITEARETRVESEERTSKLQRLGELKQTIANADTQLADLKDNDPAETERIQQLAETCREAANRWTENVWAIKSYLQKKYGMSGKELDRQIGIPADFDYV